MVRIGTEVAHVWLVPGHTAGHIAFHLAGADVIFTGDTLFALGCGRLFEGTPAEIVANEDARRLYLGEDFRL